MKREALPTAKPLSQVNSLPKLTMTTFYNDNQSETLTLEQREQRWNSERWMGEPETKQDDWLFAPLPSEQDEDEDTPPDGILVYHIETMLKGDYDEEGIPNVNSSQLWSKGELTRSEAEQFLTLCNPDTILISFVQRGDADEF